MQKLKLHDYFSLISSLKKTIFILLLFSSIQLSGQVTIFSETFNYVNTTSAGTSPEGVMWSSDCPACALDGWNYVRQFRMENQETNGPATFSTSSIDISECTSISISYYYEFSLDWEGSGNMESCDDCPISCGCDINNPLNTGCENCWDFLWGRLLLDGSLADENLIGESGTTNAEQSGTVNLMACTNGASSFNFEAISSTWTDDESVFIDDIVVICYEQPEISPNPDPDPITVCVGDDVILSNNNTIGPGSTINWSGPAGTNNTATWTLTNVQLGDAGLYSLEIIDDNNCNSTRDMVELVVIDGSTPVFTFPVSYCNTDPSFTLPTSDESVPPLDGAFSPLTIDPSTDGPSISITFTPDDPCSPPYNATITINQAPATCIETIEGCQNALGQGVYDLTSLETTSCFDGNTVVWYSDPLGMTPISAVDAAAYATFSTDVFVTIEDPTSNCISTVFNVGLNSVASPTAADEAMTECETPGTGQANFDLTTIVDNITGTTGVTVNWWDDDMATIPATPPFDPYVSSGGSIYATFNGPAPGNCPSNVATISLTVNPAPTTCNESLEGCDDGTGQGTYDLTLLETTSCFDGNTVVWYEDNTGTLVANTSAYVTSNTEVFAIITEPTNSCPSDYFSIALNLGSSPTANPITISSCSGDFQLNDGCDGDGTEPCNYSGTIDPAGTNDITFYGTSAAAMNGDPLDELSDPYTAADGDEIYARVEDPATGCFEIVTITLSIPTGPTVNDIDITSCNGEWNLTPGCDGNPLSPCLYSGDLDPSGTNSITFHSSQADAEAGTGDFTDANYVGTAGDVIYVRVQDASSNCYSVAQANLVLGAGPVAMNTNLFSCDGDFVIDETCDGNIAAPCIDDITGGNGNTVNFYGNIADAQDQMNDINGATYSALDQDQIFVVVTESGNPCVSIATITLNVDTPPTATDITIDACDDGAGSTIVDLTLSNGDVDPAGTNTVTWHDVPDASSDLIDPNNYDANLGTVYALVDDGTCSAIATVDFNLFTAPTATDITIDACDDGSGSAIVDLTLSNGDVDLAGTNTVTWHDVPDASSDLIDPNNYDANLGTVYALVDDGTCSAIATVDFDLFTAPTATDITIDACDDGAGSTIVDLTLSDDDVDPAGTNTVTWHDAPDASSDISDPNNYDATLGTVYALVDDGTCSAIATVDFNLFTAPTATDITINACDDGAGSTIVDLTLSNGDVDLAGTNTVTWHDAPDASTDISDPNNYDANLGTVYALVDDGTCSAIATVDFNLFTAPTATDITIDACDDGSGSAIVDLTLSNGDVDLAGTNTVTWHDAPDASSDISDPNNYDANLGTVYALVDDGTCSAIATVDFNLFTAPSATDITIDACDDGAGSTIVDLTLSNGDVDLAGTNTVTWHDAPDASTDISDPNNYDANLGTVYALVDDGTCSAIATVDFNLFTAPTATNITIDACDDGAGSTIVDLTLSDGDVDLAGTNTVTWHDAPDASSDISDPNNYDAILGTVYALVDDGTCSAIATVDFNLFTAPTATDITINACDDGAGSTIVDLTLSDGDVDLAGTNTVTWHDAPDASSDISDPNNYDATLGTVYALVDDGTCSAIAIVDFNLFTSPTATDITIDACDDGAGSTIVDLTLSNGDVDLAGTNTVTWHDAPDASSDIIDPNNYDANLGTVYALVDDGTCSAIATVDFNLFTAPTATDITIDACDDGAGSTIIDLTLSDGDVDPTGTNTVTWHDAPDASSDISDPNNYDANLGTVYALVDDGTCSTIATVDFNLFAAPTATDITIDACDDGAGSILVDLTLSDGNVDPSGTNNVTWHDAPDASSDISDPNNYDATLGTVYALVDDGTCSAIATVDFNIQNVPTVNPITLFSCDGNFNMDSTCDGDISSPCADDIDGGTGLIIDFYINLSDAQDQMNDINNSVYPGSDDETIYAVGTDPTTGCSSIATINLNVDAPPNVQNILVYGCNLTDGFNINPTCDGEPGNGCYYSDFIDINGGNILTFHNSISDAEMGINDFTDANYIGTEGETIFVRVEDPASGCYSIAGITLTIVPEPVLDPPTTYTLDCGDDLDINLVFSNASFIDWTSEDPNGIDGTSGSGPNIVDANLTIEGDYIYTVVVTDNTVGACEYTHIITVTVGACCNMEITNFVETPETCPNACDGTVTFTLATQNELYDIDWNDDLYDQTDVSFTSGNDIIQTGICPGTYSVTITDASGCPDEVMNIIVDPGQIPDCDDGDCSTLDDYDLTTCACINTPNPPDCDDNCIHTDDSYDPATCDCINTLNEPDCDDNCINTMDSFDLATCDCVNTLVIPDCDDNCPDTADDYNETTCECENILTVPDCDDNCTYTVDTYNNLTCECENVLTAPNCDDGCIDTADSYNEANCECDNILTEPDCDDGCVDTVDDYNETTCACENILTEPNCDDGCPDTSDSYNQATCECENVLTEPNCDDGCGDTADSYNIANCECDNILTEPDCDDGCVDTVDDYNEITCACENILTEPNCDDGCAFTVDSYNQATCECENVLTPPNCDDGCADTADSYNEANCECDNILTEPDCDDGCVDTVDDYNETTCACENILTEPNCDDGCPDTADSYNQAICACENILTEPNCDDGCDDTTDSYNDITCACENILTEPSCDDGCDDTADSYNPGTCACENILTIPDCDDNCGDTADSYNQANCECENILTEPNCDDGCQYTNDSYNPTTCQCDNILTTPDCDDGCADTADAYNIVTCQCDNILTEPDCDDNDCLTADVYDVSICDCVNSPITPGACDDGCQYTDDVYDVDLCQCVYTLTPPTCDDNCDNTTDTYNEATCECENVLVIPDCDDNCANTADSYNQATCSCDNILTEPNCDDGCDDTQDSYNETTCQCDNILTTPDCDDNCVNTADSYNVNTCACENILTIPDCDDNCDDTADSYNQATCACENILTEPNCDDGCDDTVDSYNQTTCQCDNILTTPDCDDNCDDTADSYNQATCACENILTEPDCDDNDCLTADVYDVSICACVNSPITPGACDDGCQYTDDVYDVDLCQCVYTLTPPSCDDNCDNTTDTYNEATCECENILVVPDCDDNCPNTADSYNQATCSCDNILTEPNCDDGCVDTADAYNETTCQCDNILTEPDCDDNCADTVDSYNQTTCQCENILTTPDCDDNCQYTVDTYNQATCQCDNILTEPNCDDGCDDTADSFNQTTCECDNILNEPDCDDGCADTVDSYNQATCQCDNILTEPDCDDNDCLTADVYDVSICACVNSPITPGACDDGCQYTDDVYDVDLCQCVYTLTPPNCDDDCDFTTDTYNEANCECDNILVTPDCDDNCQYTADSYDVANCECINLLTVPTCDDMDCNNGEEVWNEATCECETTPPNFGCTDPTSPVFDPNATCDDGSCSCPDPGDCDDGDCSNGEETWDGTICECVDGTPPTPCFDDMDCSNGEEVWDFVTCTCNQENVPDPTLCVDDLDCSNGFETWNAATCNCDVIQPIFGCTDPNDPEYDADANCDDGSCSCTPDGCTDPTACNFDPNATCNDGSCLPVPTCNTDCTLGDIEIIDPNDPCSCIVDIVTIDGCTDPAACNYDPNANCDDDSCIMPIVCDDGICANGLETWDDATCACINGTPPTPCTDDGNCNNGFETWNDMTCDCEVEQPIFGCTDPNDPEYDADANCDDGSCSCTPDGCTDPTACNFDPNATCNDGSCLPVPTCNTDCTLGDIEIIDPNDPCSCIVDIVTIDGCTDPAACNYDPNANCDDDSCIMPIVCDDGICANGLETWDDATCACINGTPPTPCTDDGNCNNGFETWNDMTCDCEVEQPIFGCTDPNDPEYDADANCDDGTCSCIPDGCTDPNACNFDPNATCNDGSCLPVPTCNTDCTLGDIEIIDPNDPCSCIIDIVTIDGCTDPAACNYDPNANCDDDSCIMPIVCDDGICANGLETWDDATCACINGTPPTPCTDDGICDNGFETWNDMTCDCEIEQPIFGCTDPTSPLFDPNANCDDGNCSCPDPGNCDDGNCANGDETWDSTTCECVNGTPPTPCTDDGICDNGFESWNDMTCECEIEQPIFGCTDPTSPLFDPNANCDDGNCICPDPGNCDDGVCENGMETWDFDLCQCVDGPDPELFIITQGAFDCDALNEFYDLTISITGNSAPYIVTETSGLTVVENTDGSFTIQGITNQMSAQVSVTDAMGCNILFNTIAQDCNCDPVPVPVGVNTVTYCENSTVPSLIANDPGPGFQINWYDANGFLVEIGTTFDNPPIGVYNVTALDLTTNCESETVSTSVNEVLLPEALIVQDSATLDCFTSTYTIDGSGSSAGTDITYEWQGPNGIIPVSDQSDFIVVDEAGIYTLTVVSQWGLGGSCIDTDSIFILSNIDYPLVEVDPFGTIDCNTDQVILDGSNSQTGSTITNFWVGPTTADTTQSNMITVTQGGTYTLVGVDSENGCVNDTIVVVDENTIDPIADAGIDIELPCDGSSVMIGSSNPPSGPSYVYEWSSNNNIEFPLNAPTFEVNLPGTYVLTVSDDITGCSAIDTIVVNDNINSLALGDAIGIAPECFGEENGMIVIDTILGGVPPYEYSLDGSIFFQVTSYPFTIPFLASGSYDVVFQDGNDCMGTQTVTINNPLESILDLGDDQLLTLGDSVMLEPLYNFNIDSFYWVNTTYLDCDTCLTPYSLPMETIEYLLIAVDENGCVVEEDITLFVENPKDIYVPNAFSPDADGINDVITVFAGQEVVKIVTFRIFDRWGETVFEQNDFLANDPTFSFDGNFRGKPLNPQVLVYVLEVEFVDGSIELISGDIAIIR